MLHTMTFLTLAQAVTPSVMAAGRVAEYGVLGAVVIGLALYSWRQHKELRRVENARVEDAQAVTRTLVDLTTKWAELVTETNALLKEQCEALTRIEKDVDGEPARKRR